jgi:hypothetical protein
MNARRTFVVALALLLCACAATVKSTWRDPADAGGAIRKVLVIGVSAQATARRTFEDAFAKAIAARGADAVASYTLLPELGPESREPLAAVVRDSGAEAVVVTRLVKRDTRTQVYQNPAPVTPARVPMSASLYGWYPQMWVGYYEPPTVYQYDVVVLETQLYRAAGGKLAWSAASEIVPSGRLADDAADAAADLAAALAKDGLL